MKSMTKNTQSAETLNQMAQKAFPGETCTEILELTEGYFNVAYLLRFDSGRESVLKIAPPRDACIMSYEKNIMYSEVAAMRLAAEKTDVPVAKIFFFDDSLTLCSSPYFFMEKLEGNSLFSLADSVPESVKKQIRRDTGMLNRKINSITGESFGYIGQPQMQGNDWYTVFCRMMDMAFSDAKAMSVDLKIPVPTLRSFLENSRSLFEQVTVPCLVHWDLWDGNIFVKNGRISGLIDWERSLWADPLMEVGFRTYGQDPDFLQGYGKECVTPEEQLRALWYEIYLMVLVAQDYTYRQYATTQMYDWSTGILTEKFAELNLRL